MQKEKCICQDEEQTFVFQDVTISYYVVNDF